MTPDRPRIRPGDLVLVDDAQTPLNPSGSTERGVRLVGDINSRGIGLLNPVDLRFRARCQPSAVLAIYRGANVGDIAGLVPEEMR